MKKLSLVSSIVLASLSTGAMAGNFYLGPSLFYQHNSASHSSFSGLHPRLSLGYGSMMGDYYLGGEIFAIPFTAVMSNSNSNGAVSAKTTHGFGISFIPGVMVNDTLLAYLRLGVISSKFSAPNTMKTGGQAGLGLKVPLSTRWDMRAEYIYTAYQSISGLGSVKANEIGIGFVYNFGSTCVGNYKSTTVYKS